MPSFPPAPGSVRLPGSPWTRPLPAVLLVVLMLGLAGPAAADPAARPGAAVAAGAGPTKPGYSRLVNFSAVLQPALADGDAPRAAFVELTALAAAQTWSAALLRDGSATLAAAAVRAQRQLIRALARRITAAVPTATVLFTVTDAVPGIGVLATPAALRSIAGEQGVGKISAIVPKVPTAYAAAGSGATAGGAPAGGATGAGVRVGVIDTGIDYTHADFGGAGTATAYAAARRATGADWPAGSVVVGGYDFVGDSYDAAPTTATGANPAYQPIPRPDGNPLDCNGHGTRVAAAIAGSGVPAGRPFGGLDPRPDPGRAPATDVPPGVAPHAALYAFKVFGCSGATDAVIPALDRALDPDQDGDLGDRLDVVDLSLTGTTAAADDPETDVLDALARFGVLPVVAAGHSTDPGGTRATGGSVRALTVGAAPAAPVPSAGVPGSGPVIDPSTASTDSVDAEHADVTVSGASAGAPLAGSGSGSVSGVADATAVTAGVAALVRQRQPAWTPEQIKAALLDTAGAGTGAAPVAQAGPAGEPGAPGAVDADAAIGANVLAYSSTQPGAVSVSFGIVPADVRQQQVTATAAVVVQNTGGATAELTLGYLTAVEQPGVSFQVSPATMVVQPGASTLATVTMTITPAALRRTPADGLSPQQRNPLTGLDEARQYTAAAAGALQLVSAQSTLQLPVAAAVRPVSTTSAVDGTLAGAPAVVLAGTGFSLSAPGDPGSATQQSLLSVLELGYRSPQLPPCRGVPAGAGAAACSAGGSEADLQAVGVGRTPSVGDDPGRLWFGLATYQDIPAVGRDVLPTIDIDVNGDNTADYTLQVQAVPGTDLLAALLFDDRPAVATSTAIYPVDFNLGDVDTNAIDSNVLLIPVDPAALGYRVGQASFPIRYSVTLYSAGGAAQNGMAADVTPAVDYDVAAPGLTTANPLWQDQGGTGVPYRLAPGSTGADALVLHLHGSDQDRVQTLRLAG